MTVSTCLNYRKSKKNKTFLNTGRYNKKKEGPYAHGVCVCVKSHVIVDYWLSTELGYSATQRVNVIQPQSYNPVWPAREGRESEVNVSTTMLWYLSG